MSHAYLRLRQRSTLLVMFFAISPITTVVVIGVGFFIIHPRHDSNKWTLLPNDVDVLELWVYVPYAYHQSS